MDANVDYDRGIVKTIAITIKIFCCFSTLVGYNSRFSNLYRTFIQNKNFPISIWFLRAFSIPHFITKKLNGVKQITNETFLFLFGLKEHFHTHKIQSVPLITTPMPVYSKYFTGQVKIYQSLAGFEV